MNEDFGFNIGFFILSLLVTGGVYLIFPLFYSNSHPNTSSRKAWKLSILNFFICHVVFVVICVLIKAPGNLTGAPVLWLFVGKKILYTGKDSDKEKKEKPSATEEKTLKEFYESKQKETKPKETKVENKYEYKTCTYCGLKFIKKDNNVCPFCGKNNDISNDDW